jgi:hypothetical protein
MKKLTQKQLDLAIDACNQAAEVFCAHHPYYGDAVIEISEHCELIMFDKKSAKFVESVAVDLANDEISGRYHPEVAPASLMELAIGKKLDFGMKAEPVDGEVDGDEMMHELAAILAKAMVPYMLEHCKELDRKQVKN